MAKVDLDVDITRALAIKGWMTEAELRWLAEQAREHTCIVELGSFLGRSTRALADNTDGTMYAIDRWKAPHDYLPQYADTWDEFRSNLQDRIEDGTVQTIRTDHAEISVPFSPDLVFIDGDHAYESVRRDITTWKSRLRPGGLLSGHDYSWEWPGVEQAVRELLPGYKVAPGTSIWYWRESMAPKLLVRDMAEMRQVGGQAVLDASVARPVLPSTPLVDNWRVDGIIPKNLSYAICMPFSGRYCPPEMVVAMNLLSPPPNTQYALLGTKKQRRDEARCDLIRQARELHCDYALFIDDDNPPPPETVLKLKFVLDNSDPDVAVCAGIYCSKTEPAYPLVFRGDGKGPFWKWRAEIPGVRSGEVFECESIATGCMMIRLSVFDSLTEPWFCDIQTHEDAIKYDVVKVLPPFAHIEITDDIWFCRKVRAAGFKILAHGGVLPSHWDEHGREFRLPPDSYPLQQEGGK